MFDDMSLGDWGNLAGSLAGLYGQYQGFQNSHGLNNQIQGGLGNYLSSVNPMQSQAAAQQAYQRALESANSQNQQLQGNIDTMTTNLNALSDPNSAYMKQARQAIERKDAAAGRRSQWGERETQLQGILADMVGKYGPGLQNSITAARNQINANNTGLAGIYGTMNGQTNQGLQAQLAGLNALNSTGRAAANSSTNNLTGLINNGVKALGGLSGLFGGSSGGSSIWDNLFTGSGSSGFGDGSLYGNSFNPMSSYGTENASLGGYGYGNLPASDYFGGGGFGGVPTAWDGGGFSDSIWD